CAVRECAEETGLSVTPVRLLDQLTHDYAHGTVELSFWLCRPMDATAVCDKHRSFGWVSAAELAALRFPDANAGVIRMLKEAQG
ncbi:MAG TPA: NUDIX domain-containing protein, partial [Planctomycetaceae bacterium]|nr:NUDIX domain-containing protein [Planctomycetaceae bacterium]